MELETNYLGATIFWSYIIAALFFTTTVIRTISNIPENNHKGRADSRFRQNLFNILAGLSFAGLSFNMLRVLIKSFREWSALRHPHIPSNLVAAVWRWSISSSLFLDFAEALVANRERYLLSACALITTFGVCSFMGIEGTRRRMPGLWAFFCLSQILPISFTQNLFYVALLRSPGIRSTVNPPALALAILALLYHCILAALPRAAGTPFLMPLVLVTRVLLFAHLGLTSMGEAEPTTRQISASSANASQRILIAAASVSVVLLLLGQLYSNSSDSFNANPSSWTLGSHPAVSALGYDWVMSLISLVCWHLTQHHSSDFGRKDV